MLKTRLTLLIIFFLIFSCVRLFSETRFDEYICSHLSKYQRPFQLYEIYPENTTIVNRVLSSGNFYLATVREKFPQLNSLFKSGCIVKRPKSLEEFEKLSNCEHFDVVVLNDYPFTRDYLKVIKILQNCTFEMFFSCSKKYLSNFLKTKANVVCESRDRYLLHLFGKDHEIKRLTWLTDKCNFISYNIDVNYKKKVFRKTYMSKGTLSYDFKPGINIVTFKMLEGVSPSVFTLKQELLKISNVPHKDWHIFNMIVQNSKLAFIDELDKLTILKKSYSPKRLKAYIECMEQTNPAKFRACFFKTLLFQRK